MLTVAFLWRFSSPLMCTWSLIWFWWCRAIRKIITYTKELTNRDDDMTKMQSARWRSLLAISVKAKATLVVQIVSNVITTRSAVTTAVYLKWRYKARNLSMLTAVSVNTVAETNMAWVTLRCPCNEQIFLRHNFKQRTSHIEWLNDKTNAEIRQSEPKEKNVRWRV